CAVLAVAGPQWHAACLTASGHRGGAVRFRHRRSGRTVKGKGRDDLLWPSAAGGYLGPPASNKSGPSWAGGHLHKADKSFPRVTAHALKTYRRVAGNQRVG